ncbi:argininosuccinate synthase-related protein [Streptomyces tsukubensis]|uniref:argininosuccinate synthase-related protein n=1 Tax=Streptomyces tsukubensis TaxID=83656 RepID=UPI00369D271E
MRQGQIIRSFHDLTPTTLDRRRPVVTLFSGGLDSTYLLHRLTRTGLRNIHAVSVDLGDDESLDSRRRAAEIFGAELHVIDGRREFVNEFVGPAIAAQAVYLGTHPISSSLSRPLIARLAMELAQTLDASCIVHTANRSQNTLRRINGALGLLGYPGRYGSPYDLDPVGRDQKIKELAGAGIPSLQDRIVSGDSNLWCREFESGVLEDPEHHAVPQHLYQWTAHRKGAVGEVVEIGFTSGVPTTVDRAGLPLDELIGTLNRRVGSYGIGRYSGLEHLTGGEKVLEIREMPAAWLLLRSYRHLEAAVLDAETIREKMHIEQLWVREAVEGRWFGPLRRASHSFIAACSAAVTGSVRWALGPGTAETQAVVSDRPRYLRNRESWEAEAVSREIGLLQGAPEGAGPPVPGQPPAQHTDRRRDNDVVGMNRHA